VFACSQMLLAALHHPRETSAATSECISALCLRKHSS